MHIENVNNACKEKKLPSGFRASEQVVVPRAAAFGSSRGFLVADIVKHLLEFEMAKACDKLLIHVATLLRLYNWRIRAVLSNGFEQCG